MIFSPQFIDRLHDSSFTQRLLREKAVVLDSTEFSYASACFTKWLYWGGVRRIAKAGQTPLIFGAAVHKGLAANLLGCSLLESLAAVRTQAVVDNLDSYFDPLRTTDRALEITEAYIHHCKIQPSERIVPVELNGVKMVEQNFCLPLGEVETTLGMITVMWGGVIDVIDYDSNVLWVTDHKTTTVMGPKFVDDKIRSNQVLGYVWAARQLAASLTRPVEGAKINALAHRASGYEFKSFKIPVPQWKIEEWKSETLNRIREHVNKLAEMFTEHVIVDPNREGCVTKYGRCPFFDLCESPTIMRERTIFDNSFYMDNVWNPTGVEM